MNQKELKELIDFIIEKGIDEFELERGDLKVKIKRTASAPAFPIPDSRFVTVHAAPPAVVAPAPSPAPPVPAPGPAQAFPASAPAAQPAQEELHGVRSPIVGTFYEAPSPGAPPFVKVGDHVEAGQVLCIVEAMKLMNEIECDVAGEIVKKLVANGQPIEYGQELFAIRPEK